MVAALPWQSCDSRRKPLGFGSSSYLLHSEIEPPSQKESQRSTVHVPDFCGNLFDTCLAGLQEMYPAFNAETLRAAGGADRTTVAEISR
jgi:hypothetical protein